MEVEELVKTEEDTLAWQEVYPCLDTLKVVEAEALVCTQAHSFSSCADKDHALSNIEAERPVDMLTDASKRNQRHWATHWAMSKSRHSLMLRLTRY